MSHSNKYMPFENRIDLQPLQAKMAEVKNEIKKVIVGQDRMIDQLLVAILAGGHTLIEGLPGVAKTVTAKLLAKTINAGFSRIQFTPDLMPSDVTGTTILDMKTNEFNFIQGPIFSNIVLIDEINRAPAKTQAALFECMSENQITADGNTYNLEQPFLVLATQNPIDHEGTYRLPEAQLDRFLFKIDVGYPSLDSEVRILEEQQERKNTDKLSLVNTVLTKEELLSYQSLIKSIFVHEDLIKYIATLINQTRINSNLILGASPRASIAILEVSKAAAAIDGRDFVTPEDIKSMSYAVLGHRVVLSPEKEMEGFTNTSIIQQIIDSTEIPH